MATSRTKWNGFSISNLKTMRGMENAAMECDLKFEGKKIAECYDSGWGGPIEFDMVEGYSFEKLNAICQTFREPEVFRGIEIPFEAEIFLNELIQRQQWASEVAKLNKSGYGFCMVEFNGNKREQFFNVPLSWSHEKLDEDLKRSFGQDSIKAFSFWKSPSDLDINDRPVNLSDLLVD